MEVMANDRDDVDASKTMPITNIAYPKIIKEKDDVENHIRSGENVEYTLKPPTRAYASTAR